MDCRKAKEQLSSLVDDVLSPSERASLLEHLGQCQSCRDEWQSLKSVARMVRSLPEVSPPTDFRAQLFQRLQSEPHMVVPTKERMGRYRWYQWSIAAAAVLTLVWSVRFASVKPPTQKPTDMAPSPTAGDKMTGESHKISQASPAQTGITSGQERETHRAESQSFVAQTPAKTTHPHEGSVDDDTVKVAMGLSSSVTDKVALAQQTVAPNPTTVAVAQQPPVAPVPQKSVANVPEPAINSVQTTPNPSFTVPRNALDSDRHREGTCFGTADSAMNSNSAGVAASLRLEEYVTRLRISGPGPDELRQRLRQFTQNEELIVVELIPTSKAARFSIRGTSEQIARLAGQINAMAKVVERETTVIDLRPEWLALQDLIAQTRLEIGRREEMLRQAKNHVEQQDTELQKARLQLQNQEKAQRLLESRLGTAVIEIGY